MSNRPAVPFMVLALGAALVAGCGGGSAPSAPAEDAAAPLAVRLATVREADVGSLLQVTGTVRLKRETALGFNAPGRIAAITALEGQQVRQGQVLARLDLTSLDASTRTARAELVRAEAEHKRLKGLFDQGWVTAPRVEAAAAALEAARARLSQTRFDETLGVIRAPADGVVLRRPLEPGQIVQPGQTVLIIGEAGSGHVLRLPIADADVQRLTLGQPAEVLIPALGADPLIARVSEIGGRADDATGTFRVELALPSAPGLRSGLIGQAQLRLAPREGAVPQGVTVPPTALFSVRAGEGFVYVHDAAAGAARLRQVEVGSVSDSGAIVTAGLRPGEKVIVSGPDRLRDGMRVSAAAPAAAPAAAAAAAPNTPA